MTMTPEQVVARAYGLRKQADAMRAEADDLLDSLNLTEIRDYPMGQYILKVQENKRFDAGVARKALGSAQWESILVPTPNSKVAREVLSPDEYDACQKRYDPKRSIVPVGDEE